MNNEKEWSRLPGFYALAPHDRLTRLMSLPLGLRGEDVAFEDGGLSPDNADLLSENVVQTYGLPFSVAANFIIDDKPVLVPMVTEEPSIVAAASKMAKIVSYAGGFKTKAQESVMKGQIQLVDVSDLDRAQEQFLAHKQELIDCAQTLCPRLIARGGGVLDIGMRLLKTRLGPMVLIEPEVDVVDAMGANIINTIAEGLAPKVQELLGGKVLLRILSNLCDKRLVHASCVIPLRALATDHAKDDGAQRARDMLLAHVFAEHDPYRAATHNKGIFNGIDAVAVATGNDTRAIEAAGHAFAAQNGYKPLTSFTLDEEKSCMRAELCLPLAVGVVGGITQRHKGVRLAHKMLGPFAQSSQRLASVMASVGLAQCLAAVAALCQEGIQKGHMKLHAKKHVPTE